MSIGLLVVAAVAVVACALLARSRARLRGALTASERDREALATRLARAEATIATHAADLTTITEARDVVVADWESTVSEVRRLADQLEDERRARAQAEATADDLQARLERAGLADAGGPGVPTAERAARSAEPPARAAGAAEAGDVGRVGGPADVSPSEPPDTAPGRRDHAGDADGRWMLLLAHIARRWAAVVGAPPEDREVTLGAVPVQFAEGLAREVERVREEVGVSVELAGAEPAEPADPVASLLAVIDVLGVLATGSERVVVDAGESVDLRGEGWSGSPEELTAVRARATAAGVAVGEIEVDEGTAHVSVGLTDPHTEPAATP